MFRNADLLPCADLAHKETEAQEGKEIAPHHTVKSKARTQTQVPDSHAGKCPFREPRLFTLYKRAGSEGRDVGC